MSESTTNNPFPPQPQDPSSRSAPWWQQPRKPLLATAFSAGIWIISGALHEVGKRVIEWLW